MKTPTTTKDYKSDTNSEGLSSIEREYIKVVERVKKRETK